MADCRLALGPDVVDHKCIRQSDINDVVCMKLIRFVNSSHEFVILLCDDRTEIFLLHCTWCWWSYFCGHFHIRLMDVLGMTQIKPVQINWHLWLDNTLTWSRYKAESTPENRYCYQVTKMWSMYRLHHEVEVSIHWGPEVLGCVNHIETDTEWYNRLVP